MFQILYIKYCFCQEQEYAHHSVHMSKYLASAFSVHYTRKVEHESQILVLIGKAVRNRRLKLGYTQEELSKISLVHRNFISGIERGTRNATMLTLNQIFTALDTNIFQCMAEINESLKSL